MGIIDGKTITYGVIGNPISHTKSPFIHNMLAEQTKLNMAYLPFHVKEEDLDDAIKGARSLNIKGLNVTVPHKKGVIRSLDEIDDMAKQIGAVNTLHFSENGLKGYNTDIVGLDRDLKAHDVSLENKVVCILGAGGAANAVSLLSAKSLAKKIYIVNRTLEKAELLKTQVEKYYTVVIECLSYDEIMNVNDIDICFQTTSLGMTPNIDSTPISDDRFFEGLEVAVDIVYTPKETVFLKEAKAHGVKVINGLGMLFYQALEAFEIWNGIKVSEKIVRDCYKEFYDFVYLENNVK